MISKKYQMVMCLLMVWVIITVTLGWNKLYKTFAENELRLKILNSNNFLLSQGPEQRRTNGSSVYLILNRTSTTTTTRMNKEQRKIDKVIKNDYNVVKFSLNLPVVTPTLTKDQQKNFLVVFVISGAKGGKYRRRRAAVRSTWGSTETCEQRKIMHKKWLKWLLVFVVGKAGPGTDDDKRNQEEAMKYNDMLIGEVPDNYVNLIVKVYMALRWVGSLPNVKYAVKADDDVYVRIPKLIEYIVEIGYPKRFYGGRTKKRGRVYRSGKWAVSKKYYPEKRYPKYNIGLCYIISTDLLTHLFNYTLVRKPFHIEDAYIGLAMKSAHVKAKNMGSITIIDDNVLVNIKKKSDCQFLRRILFGHKLEADTCKVLHNRIEMLCKKNETLSKC